MDRYQETAEMWNKLARIYEEKFMHLDLYNDTYDFICEALAAPNPRVLEIGCGPGNITQYLLTRRPDLQITGIDIAPNMVELAKTNNPTADFLVMDSREILQLNTSFDAIVCGFCLPYIPASDCKKLISDCSSLLPGNGLLYLSFVAGENEQSGYKTNSAGDSIYFHYHNEDELKTNLHENEFQMLHTFYINYPKGKEVNEIHTVLVCKKKR